MRQGMQQIVTAVGALAAGAGAMYYLDPQDGNRRRAVARDKTRKLANDTRDFMRSRAKRSLDKSRGWIAEVRSLRSVGPVDDALLHERIRSRLGRAVSHPHGIETVVKDGHVQLQGEVQAGELAPLMLAVWAVPGVTGIENRLTVQHSAEGRTAPQGAARNRKRPAWRGLLIPIVAIATPIAIAIGAAAQRGKFALRS